MASRSPGGYSRTAAPLDDPDPSVRNFRGFSALPAYAGAETVSA